MDVQVQEISSVVKSLTIEIPSDVVSGALSAAATKLQSRIKLPGFRPGKAPLSLLNKKYRPDLQEEVLQELVPDYYQKAIFQVGLYPVDRPVFEPISLRSDRSISFTVRVEILPTLPPIEYAGLTLPREAIQVTPEQVDAMLARLQDEQGVLEVYPETHYIALGDYVVLDLVVVLGEKRSKPETGLTIQVGAQKPILPDAIEAALVGKKKGDCFVEKMVFSTESADPHVAEKKGHFEVTVQEVKKKNRPALDDEFAKDMDCASLAELREKLTESLKRRGEVALEERQKDLLVQQLLEKYPFDVPPSMVRREAEYLAARLRGDGEGGEQALALSKECEEMAQNRVKRFFLLTAIADAEAIEASDDDVARAVAAMESRTSSDGPRSKTDDPDFTEGLKSRIRVYKVVERLYSLAHFSEVVETRSEQLGKGDGLDANTDGD